MRLLLSLFLLLFVCHLNAQNVSLSGFVRDKDTEEPLLFANCVDTISGKSVISNGDGFFSVNIRKGNACIVVSYLGYETVKKRFQVYNDTTVNIYLSLKPQELEEVVVNAYVPVNQQVIMGRTTIPIKTIKTLPSFVGEPDLMKSISFLSGVSLGKEGYSNIYVRGGDRGQNLILLDGMKLYNTNHVGGFLSLINSDVVKHVDVYKGGFPSRYGGRASSVIDIYSKDGNSKELKGSFNIGLLNSGFVLEMPLSEKMNCFVAARASYYDLFTIPARIEYKRTGLGEYWGYTFFDVNGKVNWQISPKNKLSLSIFSGHDYQKSVEALNYSAQKKNEVNTLNIHNTGLSLTSSTLLSKKVFWKNMLSFTAYSNEVINNNEAENYASKIIESVSTFSKINDVTLKSGLELYVNNTNAIKTGIEISNYFLNPGVQASYFENENAQSVVDTTVGFKTNLSAYELNAYVEDELSVGNNLKMNFGARATSYFCKDTVFYRLEPRVSLRFLLSDKFSIKANYTILNQYNHVLVNNYMGFEKEIWLAATKGMLPQNVKQGSVGFFYSNQSRQLDISVEGYYKSMRNLLEYRSPVEEVDNLNNIENVVAKNGKGKSYGIEFQVKKDFKKVSTNLNYTLSWNYRQFSELNNGDWFPFIYDKRHDLSLVTMWQISKKYSFSSNFSLASGMPSTLPVGYSKTDDVFYNYFIFDKINNRRLPLYHRLDVSLVRKSKTRKGNMQEFSINIFNVYARQNPVYIYYNSATGKVYQKSLFSIVPTVSYSIKF